MQCMTAAFAPADRRRDTCRIRTCTGRVCVRRIKTPRGFHLSKLYVTQLPREGKLLHDFGQPSSWTELSGRHFGMVQADDVQNSGRSPYIENNPRKQYKYIHVFEQIYRPRNVPKTDDLQNCVNLRAIRPHRYVGNTSHWMRAGALLHMQRGPSTLNRSAWT